jgi:hypothetical protein
MKNKIMNVFSDNELKEKWKWNGHMSFWIDDKFTFVTLSFNIQTLVFVN